MDISGRDNVIAALTSPDLAVTPAAPPVSAPLTLAWLRAGVARFSRGPEHGPRRRYAQALLDGVDPAAVRERARSLAEQTLAQQTLAQQSLAEQSLAEQSLAEQSLAAARGEPADPVTVLSRHVPVRALAEELGWPTVAVEDVAAVARVYLTGSDDPAEVRAADDAVARLAAAACAGTDDTGAARVGVLVQSYEATAVLIANACAAYLADGGDDAEQVVAVTVLENPPTARTRRMATVDTRIGDVHIPAGETVFVNIGDAGLTFGAGPHACPGAAHARAIAEGVLVALRSHSDR
jgi:cytochrome P450